MTFFSHWVNPEVKCDRPEESFAFYKSETGAKPKTGEPKKSSAKVRAEEPNLEKHAKDLKAKPLHASAQPILGPMATPTTASKLSTISVNQLGNQCQLSSQKVLVYTEDKHVKQAGSQSSASPPTKAVTRHFYF